MKSFDPDTRCIPCSLLTSIRTYPGAVLIKSKAKLNRPPVDLTKNQQDQQ